jgi:hypothetical protein
VYLSKLQLNGKKQLEKPQMIEPLGSLTISHVAMQKTHRNASGWFMNERPMSGMPTLSIMIWQETGLKRLNMNNKSEIAPAENHPNIATGIAMRFGQIAFVFIFQAVILFLAAGRLNWT